MDVGSLRFRGASKANSACWWETINQIVCIMLRFSSNNANQRIVSSSISGRVKQTLCSTTFKVHFHRTLHPLNLSLLRSTESARQWQCPSSDYSGQQAEVYSANLSEKNGNLHVLIHDRISLFLQVVNPTPDNDLHCLLFDDWDRQIISPDNVPRRYG